MILPVAMHDASPLLRQWSLLRAIASDRESTVKSLAATTGMSEKTIRRDVSLLRRVGFPIEERSGDYGRKTFFLIGQMLPRSNSPMTRHWPCISAWCVGRLLRHVCRAGVGRGLSQNRNPLVRRAAKYVDTMLCTYRADAARRRLRRQGRTTRSGSSSPSKKIGPYFSPINLNARLSRSLTTSIPTASSSIAGRSTYLVIRPTTASRAPGKSTASPTSP